MSTPGTQSLQPAAAAKPPRRKAARSVDVRHEKVVLPTYLPAAPQRCPMFLENRVYQGSSGRVYPLPFTDRIAETRINRRWQGIWIENEFLRVLILPELGGRIHVAQDKTNGYDLIYRQDVIKPALVGLAGPWISGGIEFNWPQHHRPATFMPVETEVERAADGSVTVWCSDHDPMARMKGMHGVCLHPGRAVLELKVRVHNRTPLVQTFLWWANVATRVHEGYQSFFPPDVHWVADHARRATSAYPRCQGQYYGVDYGRRDREGVPAGERPTAFVPARGQAGPGDSCVPAYAASDLSWYANIPVPTSYMCMGSKEAFFGGYDFKAQAGLVHVANPHLSPGKKQWTWGNHAFGYAWDRNLTDPDATGEHAPYIELMAGVYTDNQPDFSFLRPGETRAWSQFWYPIQRIGPVQAANVDAALSVKVSGRAARLGVAVTRELKGARIEVRFDTTRGRPRAGSLRPMPFETDLAPGKPWLKDLQLPRGLDAAALRVSVRTASGVVLTFRPPMPTETTVPAPATEPPPPADVRSADELYLIGLHLEQYRHATRCPTLYWREALHRDPLDARCNNAMGLWRLRRGELALAEAHFRSAIQRLTGRNPNPYDAEPYYNLGLCLRHQGRAPEACAAFYKATWDQGWAAPAFLALAEIDASEQRWSEALVHVDQSLALDTLNARASGLKVILLRQLGEVAAARNVVRSVLDRDPLDVWARHLAGRALRCDWQARLDLAHDYARAGFLTKAIDVLDQPAASPGDLPDQSLGAAPLVAYTKAWLHQRLSGDTRHYRAAAALPIDHCFPARLEEIAIFEAAIAANPTDARAPYYLGNLLYDRRRHREAIRLWERSVRLDPTNAVAWRNLGLGRFNILRQPRAARQAYERAFRADPSDARVFYERDQLWKRTGAPVARRLRELLLHRQLVELRDDLSVELCALLNQAGRHEEALVILRHRRFQPWEGGEGQALGQHVRTHLSLGRKALAAGNTSAAIAQFDAALNPPPNLGESRHPLANASDIHYWLGEAHRAAGHQEQARLHWTEAAEFRGDFQEMRTQPCSELTYYSALALQQLGRRRDARALLQQLAGHARQLARQVAAIDYFATSLPTLLLFEDDLQARQETTALFLQAQAGLGLGQRTRARRLLEEVLRRDPSHALAADLRAATDPVP